MFEQETVLSSQVSIAIRHTYSSYVTLCKSKSKTKAVVWQVFLAAGQALSDFSLPMAVVTALPSWGNPQRPAGVTVQQPIYASALPGGWRSQPEPSSTTVWKKLFELRSLHLATSVQMYTCFCSTSQMWNSNEAFPIGGFKRIGFHAEWNLNVIQSVLTLSTLRLGL